MSDYVLRNECDPVTVRSAEIITFPTHYARLKQRISTIRDRIEFGIWSADYLRVERLLAKEERYDLTKRAAGLLVNLEPR